MTNYATGTKLTDLSLVAEPVPAVDAPAPVDPPVNAGVSPNTSTNTDGYLAEATREYDAGNIDQALWAKALELAGNNQAFLAAPAGGPHFCIACIIVRLPERSAALHFGTEFGLNWKSSSRKSCIRVLLVEPV